MQDESGDWQDQIEKDMKKMGRFKGVKQRDYTEDLELGDKIMRIRNKVMLCFIMVSVLAFVIYLVRYVTNSRTRQADHRIYDSKGNRFTIANLYVDKDESDWISLFEDNLMITGKSDNESRAIIRSLDRKEKSIEVMTSSILGPSNVRAISQIRKNFYLLLTQDHLYSIGKLNKSEKFVFGSSQLVDVKPGLGQMMGVAQYGKEQKTDDASLYWISDGSSKLQLIKLNKDGQTAEKIREVEISSKAGESLRLGSLVRVEDYLVGVNLDSFRLTFIDVEEGKSLSFLDIEPAFGRVTSFKKENNLPSTQPGFISGVTYDPALGILMVTGKDWQSILELVVIKNQFKKKELL